MRRETLAPRPHPHHRPAPRCHCPAGVGVEALHRRVRGPHGSTGAHYCCSEGVGAERRGTQEQVQAWVLGGSPPDRPGSQHRWAGPWAAEAETYAGVPRVLAQALVLAQVQVQALVQVLAQALVQVQQEQHVQQVQGTVWLRELEPGFGGPPLTHLGEWPSAHDPGTPQRGGWGRPNLPQHLPLLPQHPLPQHPRHQHLPLPPLPQTPH